MAVCKFRYAFSLFTVFLLICQFAPSTQFVILSRSNVKKWQHLVTNEDRKTVDLILDEELEPFYDSDRIEGVKQAVYNAGYGGATRWINGALKGSAKLGYSLCKDRLRYGQITGLTILAPRQINCRSLLGLEYHTLPRVVREEDFNNFTVGQTFTSCCCNLVSTVWNVTQLPSDDGKRYAQINGVNIVQWNIYRDDYIIVHGVERCIGFLYSLQ